VIQSELWAEEGRLLNDPNNERWTTAVLQFRNNLRTAHRAGLHQRRQNNRALTPTADDPEVTVDSDTLDIMRVSLTLAERREETN
jgi:hypothetical protein